MAAVTPAELAALMQGMSDQQKMMFMAQYNSEKKDRTTALILSILLGYVGVDRFYVGDVLIGILKLITLGVCGIWQIIDWFLIMGRVDEYNRQKAQEIAATIKIMDR
jgi:TM2 domain-containing membrane protein YozV